ncbi:hypothetical protein AAFF_G00143800 [Aldrovandia affinis]|uniref:Uncharacterized protein n=1 Tax=Aldrovandia affinis TaxID=143900 RepID=A0AAD7T169_9TELE|nr:hypothetical protein AAFF_G00143800 [Aldrovandia affinis]
MQASEGHTRIHRSLRVTPESPPLSVRAQALTLAHRPVPPRHAPLRALKGKGVHCVEQVAASGHAEARKRGAAASVSNACEAGGGLYRPPPPHTKPGSLGGGETAPASFPLRWEPEGPRADAEEYRT